MADEPAPATESLPLSHVSKPHDANRANVFRYWKRPTHLQYRYLYDYRHNYYNDVIDYLDWKNRGLYRDIPRPQTWAERVLRTYTRDTKSAAFQSRSRDIELLNAIRASNNYYLYHSRDYLIRRYPALAL